MRMGAPAFARLRVVIFCRNKMGDERYVAMVCGLSGAAFQWIKRDQRTAFRSRELAVAVLRHAYPIVRLPKS